MSYKLIKYYSDSGLMLQDTSELEGFQLATSQSEFFYDPNATQLLKVAITNSNLKIIYNRSYTKIQKVAADIGGFIKFCTLILTFLTSKYSIVMFYDYFDKYLHSNNCSQASSNIIKNKTTVNSKIDFSKDLLNTPAQPQASLDKSFQTNNYIHRIPNRFQQTDKEIGIIDLLSFYLPCKKIKNDQAIRLRIFQEFFMKVYSIENLFLAATSPVNQTMKQLGNENS